MTRYLTKPIGARFEAGESVARARRGLRVVTSDTSEAGRLSELNEITGTATIVSDAGTQTLESLVHGEVVSVFDGRGAIVRATGARIRGTIALGVDTIGEIRPAVDRHDRELMADDVTPDLQGMLVLGGMTIGAAAIRKLVDVGAKGVIVGSITESEVRRVAVPEDTVRPAQSFWRSWATNGPLVPDLEPSFFTIFVTEGFGRWPMASTIFSFISERQGKTASILIPGRERPFPSYPFLCFTSVGASQVKPVSSIQPADGVVARLTDPRHLGTVVTCRSEASVQMAADGQRRVVVEIEQADNTRRQVQLCNLELLKSS